ARAAARGWAGAVCAARAAAAERRVAGDRRGGDEDRAAVALDAGGNDQGRAFVGDELQRPGRERIEAATAAGRLGGRLGRRLRRAAVSIGAAPVHQRFAERTR